MKVFMKKLKKCNKVMVFFYFILLLGYIVSLGFFTKSILNLAGIETAIRIIALVFFYLLWLIYGICALMLMFTKKAKGFVVFSIFIGILIPVFSFGSYYINKIYKSIDFTNNMILYTTNLIALEDTKFDDDSTIGMISDKEEIEGYILANKLIEKEELENEIITFDDYYVMLQAMYDGEIDSVFVSSNYGVIFSNEETFEHIEKETKVLYEYSEMMENKDNVHTSNKDLTEPFTVLILGVDSPADGLNANQAFNGDTLMLITFNPNTLTATMFSLPRDTYVPIACRNNAYAKINSSAAGGTSCVINTVEQLTDIPIDYYVKINFKGVVDLVDALGGVSVDVEEPYFRTNWGIDCGGKVCEQNSNREVGKNDLIYITPGLQTLNGEQALAYSRNRHQYIRGDVDRGSHQQAVVEAVAGKAKDIRSFKDFQKIFDVVKKNIDTNISNQKILSFYNAGKDMLSKAFNDDSDFLTIEKSYLEYYSMNIPGYAALGYYKDSLDEIVHGMKVNLELESASMIKTFSYSYGEEYEQRPLGKNRTSTAGSGTNSNNNNTSDNSNTTSQTEETLPSFVGSSKSYITTWCNARSITCTFQDAGKGTSYYNSSLPSGAIVGQSVYSGALVSNIKNITFYVNYNPVTNTEPETPKCDSDNECCTGDTFPTNSNCPPPACDSNNECCDGDTPETNPTWCPADTSGDATP